MIRWPPRTGRTLAIFGGAIGASVCASAHVTSQVAESTEGTEIPGVIVPLALTALLYVIGWQRIRHRSNSRLTHQAWRLASFTAGWLALAAALLSPIDTLGAELFSVHMVQHEVLMLIAAPLLVLGRPLPAFLWAFPTNARDALGGAARAKAISGMWGALLQPLTAWILHAIALWAWHAPGLMERALTHPAIHDLQHITFLATALLFWSSLFHTRARESQGAAVLYLFTTTVHTSVLGALITFAAHPWYPAYLATAPLHGWTALEDQQLGGLIMWVPGSLVYIAVALVLLALWIGKAGRAMRQPVVETPTLPVP